MLHTCTLCGQQFETKEKVRKCCRRCLKILDKMIQQKPEHIFPENKYGLLVKGNIRGTTDKFRDIVPVFKFLRKKDFVSNLLENVQMIKRYEWYLSYRDGYSIEYTIEKAKVVRLPTVIDELFGSDF